MKTLQVGEFKSHFSEVIENIKKGEEVAISFGKKKEKIADWGSKVESDPPPPRGGSTCPQKTCFIGERNAALFF